MSIALMTLAWKAELPSGRKLVLLALCDNANDQGECYPSIPMLAEKCSMGERTVQQHIADMEAAGLIVRQLRHGRSTVYRINSDCFSTPADSAPRRIRTPQNLHPTPADSAPSPPQNSHPTPADSAPITIKEPSKEPSPNRKSRAAPKAEATATPVELPDWLPLEAWQAYLDMRKQKGKAPTQYALRLVLGDLERFRAAGHDPKTILDASTKNGWTDVYEPKGGAGQRAAPGARQTPNEKAKQWANGLTGRNRHAQPEQPDFVDINPAPRFMG